MVSTNTKLAEALRDAATSLETIGRLAGKPYYGRDDQGEPIQTYMGHNDEVRSYAKSRAGCAREALAAYEALAAHDAEQALPLKDRPDFIAGYDAGLKDGRACERRDAAEQAAQAVPADARTSPVHQPAHGWTDADADAGRLALELECILIDPDTPMPLASRWWGSAHEALALHRQRLASEQSHGIGATTGEQQR